MGGHKNFVMIPSKSFTGVDAFTALRRESKAERFWPKQKYLSRTVEEFREWEQRFPRWNVRVPDLLAQCQCSTWAYFSTRDFYTLHA